MSFTSQESFNDGFSPVEINTSETNLNTINWNVVKENKKIINILDDLNKKLQDKYNEELEPYKKDFLTFKQEAIEKRIEELETNNCNLKNEVKELQQFVAKTFKEKDDEIKWFRVSNDGW